MSTVSNYLLILHVIPKISSFVYGLNVFQINAETYFGFNLFKQRALITLLFSNFGFLTYTKHVILVSANSHY